MARSVAVLTLSWNDSKRSQVIAVSNVSLMDYGAPPPRSIGPLAEQIAELVRNGMPPSEVAAMVLNAVRDNELYIFTHADMRAPLEARVDRFLTAYRKLGPAPQETKQ